MNYNVLDSRTYSLMRRIDWRRTQDRVMSDEEAKRMNADAVKMLSYIAALELAVKCFDAQSRFVASNVVGFANVFEEYLIGDAELPELVSGVDEILEAVEIFKKQMPEFNKTDNGQMEFLLPAPQDRKLMTENESEDFKAMLLERGYIAESANILLGNGNIYKKSFDGFILRLYISKRVGGYVVSSTMNIGEGVDAPRFTIADYDLDIDRIECAALKLYGCYCETINLDEGV